jgi:hypothetical protein
MSAYLVPDFHINALVSWARDRHGSNAVSYYWEGRRREVRNDEKRIASVLYAQNVRSVNHRYNESDAAHGFKFQYVSNVLNPIDVIKGCHGYGYQACETDDWQQTEAHAIIEGITQSAIRALPGYQESRAWCISGPEFNLKATA